MDWRIGIDSILTTNNFGGRLGSPGGAKEARITNVGMHAGMNLDVVFTSPNPGGDDLNCDSVMNTYCSFKLEFQAAWPTSGWQKWLDHLSFYIPGVPSASIMIPMEVSFEYRNDTDGSSLGPAMLPNFFFSARHAL